MIPFNNKKHSDITVTISEGDCAVDETRVFYLHKFPLISKSVYFDLHIPLPAEPNAAATVDMKISHFPGGPNAFEMVARYCYGLDIELNVDNIAPVYCAARVLQVADLEKSTEDYMQTFVLTDIVKAATVLKITAGISNMTEAMMAGLVGHCINAIAARFAVIPELSSLPPECFVVVVKTARDMDAPKRVLEQAVLAYLKAHISPETGVQLTVEDFLSVVAGPGKLDDMPHCESLYSFLAMMLNAHKADTEAEALCRGLHELGFWVSLPHAVIEEAYRDKNIPDRYCTVALMAENRHMIKMNEELSAQVEHLSLTLKTMTAQTVSGMPQ
jgi:hypothetical protein